MHDEPMDWISIADDTDLPPDDDLYLFTVEHSDGGRSTKMCSRKDSWQGVTFKAWMPVPDPFGGERLPIDANKLAALVGQIPNRDIPASLGLTYRQFHGAIHRYATLKNIWFSGLENNV